MGANIVSIGSATFNFPGAFYLVPILDGSPGSLGTTIFFFFHSRRFVMNSLPSRDILCGLPSRAMLVRETILLLSEMNPLMVTMLLHAAALITIPPLLHQTHGQTIE